ncbi:MAG: TIGR02757 family protein [Planctomycetes bacterium]|nr:TIGR02757 family protein [Planctomycetota bacterium]
MEVHVRQTRILLERLYAKYNQRVLVPPDPLQFVYRYMERRDMEIVAFLASALAYGRVRQIDRSLTQLLERMDNAPYYFTSRFDGFARARLRTFKHRFTTGDDVSDLLALFRRVFDDCGSLESFFALGYCCDDATVLPALSRFCNSLCQMHGKQVPAGLNYLLANPSRGSASKRLNLFLRWMVRRDEVDPGLWTRIDPARLVVPMDVHMARLCRILGLHDDRQWRLDVADFGNLLARRIEHRVPFVLVGSFVVTAHGNTWQMR